MGKADEEINKMIANLEDRLAVARRGFDETDANNPVMNSYWANRIEMIVNTIDMLNNLKENLRGEN